MEGRIICLLVKSGAMLSASEETVNANTVYLARNGEISLFMQYLPAVCVSTSRSYPQLMSALA
jgi:hypothetical protein